MKARWFGVLMLVMVGCGGTTDADAGVDAPSTLACAELASRCHDVAESGVAELVACHELGHDGEEAMCAAMRDSCIALCEAAAGDGGTTHAHEDGGHEH